MVAHKRRTEGSNPLRKLRERGEATVPAWRWTRIRRACPVVNQVLHCVLRLPCGVVQIEHFSSSGEVWSSVIGQHLLRICLFCETQSLPKPPTSSLAYHPCVTVACRQHAYLRMVTMQKTL